MSKVFQAHMDKKHLLLFRKKIGVIKASREPVVSVLDAIQEWDYAPGCH
jgi:predicted ATPase